MKDYFASTVDAVLQTVTVGGLAETIFWDVSQYSITNISAGTSCPNIVWLVTQTNGDDANDLSFLEVNTSLGLIALQGVCDANIGTH